MDPTQLKIGIRIEREHFRDANKACRVAVDHLAERRDYYKKLKKAGL